MPWIYPKEGDPVLYINVLDESALTVTADVSGRSEGTTEVIAFVSGLLGEFDGVATDDFTDHFWTLEEIERGELEDGTKFFDSRASRDL